jgi:hypothetical protein
MVPDGIFDAFRWCESDVLEWGRPTGTVLRGPEAARRGAASITADNPPGMVFVMRRPLPFLPRELARLHVPGMGFQEEWALAPWGIDDATDLLYEHRARPGDHLWLATESVEGLFWGLHDWAHFHNHGAFEPHQRAWTELQCDATALAWMWVNRAALGMADDAWEDARRSVAVIAQRRFDAPASGTFDALLFDADRIRALVA